MEGGERKSESKNVSRKLKTKQHNWTTKITNKQFMVTVCVCVCGVLTLKIVLCLLSRVLMLIFVRNLRRSFTLILSGAEFRVERSTIILLY